MQAFNGDLRPQDRLKLHNLGGPSAESRSDAPTTVIFQTRNGRVGVAQVVSRTENPRGVTFRFKLVQSAQKAKAAAESSARDAARAGTRTPAPSPTTTDELLERFATKEQIARIKKIEAFIKGAPFTRGTAGLVEPAPDSKGAYHLRPEVVTYPVVQSEENPNLSTWAKVFYLPAENKFYVEWAEPLGSSLGPRLYGPFEGDPAKVLGLSPETAPAKSSAAPTP